MLGINDSNNRTKLITISAMLTAMCLAYVYFMPTLDLGVWSFTPLSHLFLFIALFIAPFAAIMTYIATTVAFMLSVPLYLVWLRAASHIFFMIFLMVYLKIFGRKSLKSVPHIVIMLVVSGIIHVLFEIAAVYIGLGFGWQGNNAPWAIWGAVGLAGFGHHTLDFLVALFLFKAIRAEKMLGLIDRKSVPISEDALESDVASESALEADNMSEIKEGEDSI